VCLAVLLAASSQAAAATPTNLLLDGGFEGGGIGWQAFPQPGVTVNIANYSNSSAFDGSRYEEANTSVDAGSIYQDVPVDMAAGQSATFSMWARIRPGVAVSGQAVNLCLWALTSSPTSACQRVTLTNTWQQLQATATMATTTTTLRAQLYMYGRNNIDFDGGVLSANLLLDGGFEGGGIGWQALPVGGGTVNIAAYSSPSAHDGSHYEEANTSVNGGSIYQDVPVSLTGQSATFSMWVRLAPGVAATGQAVSLCLYANDNPATGACQKKTITGSWQQLQSIATMPAATSALRAQVYMYGTGSNIDFDGGSLTPDLLTDGGFEAGGQGWTALPTGGGVVNMANYAGSAHDGTRYEEANTSVNGGSIYQDVPVSLAAGQSATFSAWVRLAPGVAAAGQAVSLCLYANDNPATGACQKNTLTSNWQELQATATMATTTSTLRAQLYMYGTGRNIDFDGASLGAPQTADEFYVPQSTGPPSISGATSVGATVTCSQGSWSNDPESFTYVWQDDGTAIAGATSATHTLAQADAGRQLRCAVTAGNPAGTATAVSGPVAVTASTPVTVALPTSHKRRAVKVRLIVSWSWNHAHTRLTRIRAQHLPRDTSINVTCRGRGCPQRAHATDDRRLRSLLKSLAGTRFHAGDRVLIVLRAPRKSPERIEIFIHNGRMPTAKLL
jgi:Carbohydrate binding domain